MVSADSGDTLLEGSWHDCAHNPLRLACFPFRPERTIFVATPFALPAILTTLKPTFRLAIAFSLGQKYIAFVVQLLVAVILARLLTPQETGVFSLAAAAVSIGHLLREFGISDYIISQKDASLEKLRAAFTVTVLFAWGIAALLWVCAEPMAAFYREPGVAQVMRLLCLNFLLLPFGSMAFAMLSKNLQFGRIFGVQTSATIVSAVVTVWLAWAGYSYMSLAIGSVVSNVLSISLLLWLQQGNVFLRPTTQGLGAVLRFGGSVTVTRIIEQLSYRSNDFIVSGSLGFHASGLLSKSNSLIGSFHEFFSSAVVRVATPAFAKAEQEDGDSRQRYFQATVLVATAQWIFFPVLGIFANEIIGILFGANWLECVPVVQVAAVGAMIWAPFMLSTALLTARGAVTEQLRIQLVYAPLLIAAIFVGSWYSLMMIAILGNLTIPVRLYLIDRVMTARCNIRFRETMAHMGPSMLVATVGIAVGLLSRWALVQASAPAFVTLIAGSAALVLASLAAAAALHHPVYGEARRIVYKLVHRAG